MTPKYFASKVREALHIATLYPQQYPGLAKAAEIFKIQVLNRSQVQAVLTDKQTGLKKVQGNALALVQHGTEPAGVVPGKVMGKQSVTSIITHILHIQQTQPSNGTMTWPTADLSREDKVRLLKWCHSQPIPWILLVSGKQVTISRKSKNMTEDLEWSPDDDD